MDELTLGGAGTLHRTVALFSSPIENVRDQAEWMRKDHGSSKRWSQKFE